MAPDWRSYDSAAESHDRVAAPSYFERPAGDLVSRMEMASAVRILDVGTGSGLAGLQAAKAAGPGALVVGLDPSLEMLRIAQGHGLRRVAAGVASSLPFADRVFDRVLASFVLNHLPSYETGMAEMVRVLRQGAKLGVTTWGPLENEHREFWQSLAESFVDKRLLAEAIREALPWEEWFTDPGHLSRAFQTAGLTSVEVHRAEYATRTTIRDFLAMREASLQARFMRHNLDAARWERFRATSADAFAKRFKDPIEHTRDVFITIGSRP